MVVSPVWRLAPAMLLAASIARPAQLASPTKSSTPHVTLRLVSEESAVAPGQTFSVGVDFRLDPGWHIYWLNAGDSGQPPGVTWNAPSGVEVGPLEWPRPTRIVDSDTI